MNERCLRLPGVLLILVVASMTAARLRSEQPAVPKGSSYASAADLLSQVDFFIKRADESLADPARFDLAKQSRTLKDGNTLAALALVLAMHDEDHAVKATAGDMIKAAQSLAQVGDNAKLGGEALAAIKQARSGKPAGGGAAEVQWGKVASLPALMKQVPLIHTGLKRGVEPNRLSRQAAQSAGQAATLAAIAQASMFDPEYAKSPNDAAQWARCCAEMRDAAGEVNSAVHAQAPERVADSMKRLTQSCDACHERFRTQ